MPYSHLQHIQLLRSLYDKIHYAFVEIEAHPMDLKIVNDALVSVEAKIYIHNLDKLELEKSTDEEVGEGTLKADWFIELKTIFDNSKTRNEHGT